MTSSRIAFPWACLALQLRTRVGLPSTLKFYTGDQLFLFYHYSEEKNVSTADINMSFLDDMFNSLHNVTR